jgi:CBS domain-containing protein
MRAMPATASSAEGTNDFLRGHAPFDRMTDAALAFLVPRLQLVHFAKDERILSTQSEPLDHLYIVTRGLVGSRPNSAKAEPDRMLVPGDLFPIGALSAGGTTTKVFYAIKDTDCYLLPRQDFLELRQISPEFERYCTQAITETLKQSLESLHSQYSQRVAEQQTLARTLKELVRNPPVTCPATASLREAARKMADANVRTIIVLEPAGAPIGMFTLVDLLERVVLPGLPLDLPVAQTMSSPIVALPASATAYEAMHVMAERGIRQIVVVENGQVVGVVNERDLFALQRVSMQKVNEGLQSADSVGTLKRAAGDIRQLTQNLLAQGVGAEPVTRTIAALNDALSRRAIEIVLVRHDIADFDWCWLALGSEGRGEQTFATDQDNALLFSAADATQVSERRRRLVAFAQEVNVTLDALGFPLCKGGVMAGNAEYCLSMEEWKERFLGWIRAPSPPSLLGANIMFDFRPLYGVSTLSDAMRIWLFRYTKSSPLFLRLMVQNALDVEPPLGLIRTFSVDDEPGIKGTIDLKTRGTRLFVDCARVFALERGIADTGTAARLRLAAAQLGVQPRHVDATVEAFHFLQLLRLRRQDQSGSVNDPNRIDPYALNEIDQRMLKEALRQAKQLQERLRLSYRL